MPSSLDHSNLRQVILDYPHQLSQGNKMAEAVLLPKKDYSNLIICGMGGSALPGEMLRAFLENSPEKFDLPIYLCRDYRLPRVADEKSLIFISSYSGNTEETVSCLEETLKIGAQPVVLSSGGKIASLAKEKELPWVDTTVDFPNFQPRYATTYVFAAMLSLLTNSGLYAKMEQWSEILPENYEALGRQLAAQIQGKTPIIYASDRFKFLAQIIKIKLNENAKTPAFWNYLPEANHNEMVGFTLPQAKFFCLMLVDSEEHPQLLKRFAVTAQLYREKGLETEQVGLEGKNFLEKFLFGCVIGDWLSYYLAEAYGIDPTPVAMVEDLKSRLA